MHYFQEKTCRFSSSGSGGGSSGGGGGGRRRSSTTIYLFNTVVLRGCSINRMGNTLQRGLQNVHLSSRKGCQDAQLPDQSRFKKILKTRHEKIVSDSVA
jgi:hypothetical protein